MNIIEKIIGIDLTGNSHINGLEVNFDKFGLKKVKSFTVRSMDILLSRRYG